MRHTTLISTLVFAWAGLALPLSAQRVVFGGQRPAVLEVPVAYDGTVARPLLVVLHGYTSSGLNQDRYFGLDSLANREDVFVISPNGTVDGRGNRFWNATDACCDLGGKGVDDVAYLEGLIASVRRDYRIDPRRIYLLGHSNGAFMAHRMACEDADRIAAIAALAGATWEDPSRCEPDGQVSVLDIHGDADRTIHYDGGSIQGHAYPGESTTMARWRGYDGCGSEMSSGGGHRDLDTSLPGAETTVSRARGCLAGLDVELWTIHGGGHVPHLAPDFARRVWRWLEAHPKPVNVVHPACGS